MKYGSARFVYGFLALLLLPGGLLVVVGSILWDGPTTGQEFLSSLRVGLIMGGFPLCLGGFALSRFRYWHRAAIERSRKGAE